MMQQFLRYLVVPCALFGALACSGQAPQPEPSRQPEVARNGQIGELTAALTSDAGADAGDAGDVGDAAP